MQTGFPNICGSFNSDNHLRKTSIIDSELLRLNVSIAALQETRLADEGSLRETNYTFYWKGKDATQVREHGVGFAIRNDLLSSVEGPRGISERIMILRISTEGGFMTIIAAYAPTLSSALEAQDHFYTQLSETVRGVRSGDRFLILGDFNARVGQDNTAGPECIGGHGVGRLNANGQRLLEFCSQNQLCITNTYFKGKFMRKVSWMHPRSKHWHQLDVVLYRKKNLQDILHTRTFHSADCESDHSLVMSCVRLNPKKIHCARPVGKKKISPPSSGHSPSMETYEKLVCAEIATWSPDISADEEWARVKRLLTVTAAKAFGFQTNLNQDCLVSGVSISVMELVSFAKEVLQNVAERAASYRVGQTVIRYSDRALWIVEKSARWAVPPPLDQEERPQPELVRPLPWVFFLALLAILRVTRESISLINLMRGKPPLRSADVVCYIQSKRRYLRTLKYQGNRIMRARSEPATHQSWFSQLQSLFEFTLCFRRQHYGNNNTQLSNGDEIMVVKRSKRVRQQVNPVPTTSETSMERVVEKIMVDIEDSDDCSDTLTNVTNPRSEISDSHTESDQDGARSSHNQTNDTNKIEQNNREIEVAYPSIDNIDNETSEEIFKLRHDLIVNSKSHEAKEDTFNFLIHEIHTHGQSENSLKIGNGRPPKNISIEESLSDIDPLQ
ncbi:unnamed protein product, partial [Brenthis ino]